MNALSLYHDLKVRGVILEVQGEHLKVDAPTGVLTEEDRTSLVEFKPILLKFLSRMAAREPEDDGRRFEARRSRHPGYTSVYDPCIMNGTTSRRRIACHPSWRKREYGRKEARRERNRKRPIEAGGGATDGWTARSPGSSSADA